MSAKRRSGRPRASSGASLTPRRLRRYVLLALTLLGALGFYGFAPGRVIRVADGDTLTVLSRERNLEKVRLYGIDAPERDQPWGAEAGDFLSSLTLLREVELSVVDKDQYGRLVALLRLPDGRLANEELVRLGHAWVYKDYCREPRCAVWLALELEARLAGRGLWGKGNPTPPWRWRRQ